MLYNSPMRHLHARVLSILGSLAILAGVAAADIAPGPGERRSPRPAPTVPHPPADPAPAPRKCGVGLGLLIFGLGVAGAWRLSKGRPTRQEAGA